MGVDFNFKTNVLDVIREGDTYFIKDGQLIQRSPVLLDGDIVLSQDAHVIVE